MSSNEGGMKRRKDKSQNLMKEAMTQYRLATIGGVGRVLGWVSV